MPEDVYTFTNVRVLAQKPRSYHCQIGQGLFYVPFSQIISKRLVVRGLSEITTTLYWAEAYGAKAAFEAYGTERATKAARPLDLPKAAKVFKRLAVKYHPDRNSDAEEFMMDLNELWQAVWEDTKRR